jgi:hypothetical protein
MNELDEINALARLLGLRPFKGEPEPFTPHNGKSTFRFLQGMVILGHCGGFIFVSPDSTTANFAHRGFRILASKMGFDVTSHTNFIFVTTDEANAWRLAHPTWRVIYDD